MLGAASPSARSGRALSSMRRPRRAISSLVSAWTAWVIRATRGTDRSPRSRGSRPRRCRGAGRCAVDVPPLGDRAAYAAPRRRRALRRRRRPRRPAGHHRPASSSGTASRDAQQAHGRPTSVSTLAAAPWLTPRMSGTRVGSGVPDVAGDVDQQVEVVGGAGWTTTETPARASRSSTASATGCGCRGRAQTDPRRQQALLAASADLGQEDLAAPAVDLRVAQRHSMTFFSIGSTVTPRSRSQAMPRSIASGVAVELDGDDADLLADAGLPDVEDQLEGPAELVDERLAHQPARVREVELDARLGATLAAGRSCGRARHGSRCHPSHRLVDR